MTNFETETCSRCGGEGRYSFNGQHSICYKCGGKCETLTKRGAAAADLFVQLCSKRIVDLEVGDRCFVSHPLGGKFIWDTLIAVEPATAYTGEATQSLTFAKMPGMGGNPPNTMMRVAQSDEAKAAKLAEALAFQATLGKNGKPSRRAA